MNRYLRGLKVLPAPPKPRCYEIRSVHAALAVVRARNRAGGEPREPARGRRVWAALRGSLRHGTRAVSPSSLLRRFLTLFHWRHTP